MLVCALASAHAQRHGLPPSMQISKPPIDNPVSGFHFLTRETQVLQKDEFANPGYLWVAAGGRAFEQNVGAGSCASCHDAKSMIGAATRYPQFDATTKTLINLEGRINQCRTKHQQLPALAAESQALLSLSSFVAEQSQGRATSVSISGDAEPWFEQGSGRALESPAVRR